MLPDQGNLPVWHYPALTGCIGEARAATAADVRRLADRLWREALLHRDGDEAARSFSARRALIRAARAALGG